MIKTTLYDHKLTFDFFELFRPDALTGDHYYRPDHYDFAFRSLGYRVEHLGSSVSGPMIIIARKRSG